MHKTTAIIIVKQHKKERKNTNKRGGSGRNYLISVKTRTNVIFLNSAFVAGISTDHYPAEQKKRDFSKRSVMFKSA